MNNKITRFFIGIDNGVSGSIGIIAYGPEIGSIAHFVKTPTKSELNYTKKASNITRIDAIELEKLFRMCSETSPLASTHVMIERPMVNPKMFQATISAIRALEATQTVLEVLKLPYEHIDSKEWQKKLLPSGIKGEALKPASLNIAERMYPGKLIKGHKDADGLLIAHYCMLKNK